MGHIYDLLLFDYFCAATFEILDLWDLIYFLDFSNERVVIIYIYIYIYVCIIIIILQPNETLVIFVQYSTFVQYNRYYL